MKIKLKLWFRYIGISAVLFCVFFGLGVFNVHAATGGKYGGGSGDGSASATAVTYLDGGPGRGDCDATTNREYYLGFGTPTKLIFANVPAAAKASEDLSAFEVYVCDNSDNPVKVDDLDGTTITVSSASSGFVVKGTTGTTTKPYNKDIGGAKFDDLYIEPTSALQLADINLKARIDNYSDISDEFVSSVINLNQPFTIISPEPGAELVQDTTIDITWDKATHTQSHNCKIQYYDGNKWQTITTTRSNSCTWTPSFSGNTKIKIDDVESESGYNYRIYSVESGEVTIKPGYVINSPQAGNKVAFGNSSVPITWDVKGNKGSVNIYLSTDEGNTYYSIGNNDNKNGSFNWNTNSLQIPDFSGSTTCKIKIEDSSDPNETIPAQSGIFTLQKLVVEKPVDVDLTNNPRLDIYWKGLLSGELSENKAKIELCREDTCEELSEQNVPENDQNPTQIKLSLPIKTSQNYKVKITAINKDSFGYTCSVESEPFKIKGKLEITSPGATTEWPVNQQQIITWNTKPEGEGYSGVDIIEKVNLYYSVDNGAHWKEIAGNITNNGSYPWTPTETGSHCKIKIVDANVSETYHESAPFKISGLAITSPSENEPWEIDNTKTIKWSSNGVSKVDIELRYHDGTVTIANNQDSQDGVHELQWLVGDYPSDNARIVIKNSTGEELDSVPIKIVPVFTIIYPNGGPNGGEKLYVGKSANIEWKTNSRHVTKVKLQYDIGGKLVDIAVVEYTAGPNESHTYTWTIPDDISDKVKIKIFDQTPNHSSIFGWDYSDSYFSIFPEFTFLRPTGVSSLSNSLYDNQSDWNNLYICNYPEPIEFSFTGTVTNVGIQIALKDPAATGEYSSWRHPETLKEGQRKEISGLSNGTGSYTWTPPDIYDPNNANNPLRGSLGQNAPHNDYDFCQNPAKQPYPAKIKIIDLTPGHPVSEKIIENPFGIGYLRVRFNNYKAGTTSSVGSVSVQDSPSGWDTTLYQINNSSYVSFPIHYFKHYTQSQHTTTFTPQNTDFTSDFVDWDADADQGKSLTINSEHEFSGVEIYDARSCFFYEPSSKSLKAIAWIEYYGSKRPVSENDTAQIEIYDLDSGSETPLYTFESPTIDSKAGIFEFRPLTLEESFNLNKLYYVETKITYKGQQYIKGDSVNFATLLRISQMDEKINQLQQTTEGISTGVSQLLGASGEIKEAVGVGKEVSLYDKVDKIDKKIGEIPEGETLYGMQAKIYQALGVPEGQNLYTKLSENLSKDVANILKEQQTKILNGPTTIMPGKDITIRFRTPTGLPDGYPTTTINVLKPDQVPLFNEAMPMTKVGDTDNIFEKTIHIPADAPLGEYTVICQAQLQQDLSAMDSITLTVTTTDLAEVKNKLDTAAAGVDSILSKWGTLTAEDIRNAISLDSRPLSAIIEQLLLDRWGDLNANSLKAVLDGLDQKLGKTDDSSQTSTIFGKIAEVKEKWGDKVAEDIFQQAQQAKDLITTVRAELGTEGKVLDDNTTIYGRLVTLQSFTDNVETSLGTIINQTAQISSILNNIAGLDQKINIIDSNIETMNNSFNNIKNLLGSINDTPASNTIFGKLLGVANDAAYLKQAWQQIDLQSISSAILTIQANLGSVSDTKDKDTIFGRFAAINSYIDSLRILVGSVTDADTANTLFGKMSQIGKSIADEKIMALVGAPGDSQAAQTLFGKLQSIALLSEGITTAQTSAQNAADRITELRNELGTEGKVPAAYEMLVKLSDSLEEIKSRLSNVVGSKVEGGTLTAGVVNKLVSDINATAQQQGLVGLQAVTGKELAGLTPDVAQDAKEVKAKLEDIRTVLEVIKQATAKEEEPVIKTWFE